MHRASKWAVGLLLSLSTLAAVPGASLAQAPAGGAAPANMPAEQTSKVVADVQAFYNRTTSFSSDFTQTYLVKAYNQTKTSKGHVVFSKPGKMDWRYAEPKDNRVVSDGTTLKAYEAGNKQMYEQTISQSQYPAALSFLTGQGQLAQLFKFTMMDGESLQFPGGWVLVGEPLQPTPAYTKVLFYVDKKTSQVMRVLVLDGQGNRNRFDFSNPQVNLTVPATQFQFTPPPGTSIVRP